MRDDVINFISIITKKTEIKVTNLLKQIDIDSGKYYSWSAREGLPNFHNGKIPKQNWLLEWEKEAIINYAKSHLGEGYRRLTYMMLDEDIVAVSPSSTYRVLRFAGLLNRWNETKTNSKGTGFIQPLGPNEHWHVDIKYINFKGTFLFLISVIDGYSRYNVHHELRQNMQEYDVQLTIQKAIEKYPAYRPRIISDNGSQFICKDFAQYMKFAGLQHIKTSIAYPQGNGKIERYHRTAGEECLSKSSFIDLEDARKQIAEFVEFYNTKRLHSSLHYLTPEDFMLGRMKEKLEVRESKLTEARKNRIEMRNAV
ncbi:MAG: DDE-type integrase/transposase/recombinase [Bacteroidetes bacterium]|nr:DDE-type integrase/transposase/recombinase [Bacteroidota bacterium]